MFSVILLWSLEILGDSFCQFLKCLFMGETGWPYALFFINIIIIKAIHN